MKRVIIISNRLPVTISIEKQKVTVAQSVGGLATGLKSVHEKHGSLWVGWPGIESSTLTPALVSKVDSELDKAGCLPVHLSEDDLENFYNGFSNKTIWPLFHYFAQYVDSSPEYWESYRHVNRLFADAAARVVKEGDFIWIHDYHLLLLPGMLKEMFPDNPIGFFLHIPFPSYELFRTLPWRNELIMGMLGADLLGFHTFDYERHFLSTVRRLLGYDISFNTINVNNRIVKADVFPMGIDYTRFHEAALERKMMGKNKRGEILQQIEKLHKDEPEFRLVLSIDRLDYTKGIPNRIIAFEQFLERYPQYLGKVSLVMLAVPSRDEVDQYQALKKHVDELVGRVNGRFARINWTPVWYFYRSMSFDELVDLYMSSDIGLLTPVRDGMNLVAKEYIATRVYHKGVLILSEMAGASKEMSEALIINPNNLEEVTEAIYEALVMTGEEQKKRLDSLQKRLRRYNVQKWTGDFLDSLAGVSRLQSSFVAKNITPSIINSIKKSYSEADQRIIFLDYDGTLVGFHKDPAKASPDREVYEVLDQFAADKRNSVVIISGRDRKTLSLWFGERNYCLIAEHGVWTRCPGKRWKQTGRFSDEWKEVVRPALEFYVDRTPGSLLEEKSYSLVWHYRGADPELGPMRAIELKDEMTTFLANHDLEILEGNKVVEIKTSGINKGRAALEFLSGQEYGFIMGVGDDWTDEYLFGELPPEAFTIKVGLVHTRARFTVEDHVAVRKLLRGIIGLK